jgi:hypothetical protein
MNTVGIREAAASIIGRPFFNAHLLLGANADASEEMSRARHVIYGRVQTAGQAGRP